jgi:hypothetical protein
MAGMPTAKWTVFAPIHNSVLNRGGEWEFEPMPSSRTDEFLARVRFDTLLDAVAAYNARKADP